MKYTKSALSLGLLVFLLAVGQTEARGRQDEIDDDDEAYYRSRRQTSSDKQLVGASAMAMATGGVSSMNVGTSIRPTKPLVATSVASPSDKAAAAAAEEDIRDDVDQRRPAKKLNKVKRPQKSRPSSYQEEDEGMRHHRDEDQDCDEDHYSYGDVFESMAMNPMRHFRRMMDSVLDQMPNNFGYYGGEDSVASAASASFNSRDGGYSKLSSSVTNNGRTRGIVSETRNGRTKTRRIGDDRDDIEE